MFRWHRVLFCAVAFLALASPAHATLLRVDFTVTGVDGPAAGQTSSGYFIFSSRDLPPTPNGSAFEETTGFPLWDLSFDWDGVHWDKNNAGLWDLETGPDGSLKNWGIEDRNTLTGSNTTASNYFVLRQGYGDMNYTDATGRWFAHVDSWNLSEVPAGSNPRIVAFARNNATSTGYMAVSSDGAIYAFDIITASACGTSPGNMQIVGNLFDGAPVSPVVAADVTPQGIRVVLENGDLWRWCDSGGAHGQREGNIFASAGVTAVNGAAVAPLRSSVALPRPNPFNPRVEIPYRVASRGHVSARVYDASGRLVRTVEDAERPPGSYTARWDGSTDTGTPAASGTYFFRLTFPDGSHDERKLTILR